MRPDSIAENDLEFLVLLPQFLSAETADTQHNAQLHVALGINPGLCAYEASTPQSSIPSLNKSYFNFKTWMGTDFSTIVFML